ncbi:unnamed protein product [Didymodactylos carnosus]|uniref:3-beta hydroxysteroid dehydrogenase/isomerase domain-containing protein n=2 Tax=Didymodactylos carnosus TaxID=1234261 RepID=A0A8S2CVD9_9BILA|nr:unnamed protein product [Didymodactylos carnosus]CAF3597279.1 unnamed protein product [Didymodactylos carnosus]
MEQNSSSTSKIFLPPIPSDKFFMCDITDKENITSIIQDNKFNIIIHLAAVLETETIENINRININGTRNVLDACRQTTTVIERVIYASSMTVVFGYLNDEPYRSIYDATFHGSSNKIPRIQVDQECRPSTLSPSFQAYSQSKIIGEQLAEEYNLSVICARFGAITTTDQCNDSWLSSCWCSHRDACQFLDLALEIKNIKFEKYFVLSNNEFLWVDIEKTKRDLGYRPQDGEKGFVK